MWNIYLSDELIMALFIFYIGFEDSYPNFISLICKYSISQQPFE